MDPAQPNLDAQTIQTHLHEMLDAVLSSGRTISDPATQLARCSRAQQDFALHWLDVIIRTNTELGFQFISHVARALAKMNLAQTEQWIIHAMDVYDRQGLYPGSQVLAAVDDFSEKLRQGHCAVQLDSDAGAILTHYLRGLSGRALRIESGDTICTDTEALYLPDTLNRYASRDENHALYRLIATQLWAQTSFGTFRRTNPNAPLLSEQLSGYADPDRARQLFERLEQTRLDAGIRRALPGLARQMDQLWQDPESPNLRWQALITPLCRIGATIYDTLAVLRQAYPDTPPVPQAPPWATHIDIALAEKTIGERFQREQTQLREALSLWLQEQPRQDNAVTDLKISTADDSQAPLRPTSFVIEMNGARYTAPPAVSELMQSLTLDFDQLPAMNLATAVSENYDAQAQDPTAPDLAEDHENQDKLIYRYDEWDFRRGHYRKDWCTLREVDMPVGSSTYCAQTIEKYKGSVIALRRSFEALRAGVRRAKRQYNGDEIDLDALVEARVDKFAGEEMSDRVLSRLDRYERDIATIFMIDVSGSTRGWINDAERECLVLLCEALQILGDRYAIYGFSGMTRKRCDLYRIKRMDEAYSDVVKARIAGIEPKDYTRMGVTIRHLTRRLNEVPAKTRLLITLSDGKPDDYDGYRGEYGIEDTRQALIEAKRSGIHPFCITIDQQARDYLPHMYGAVNYTLVDDVRRLPIRVSNIYRRLTV